MIDIEGAWHGNYSYAKGYDYLPTDLVHFELKIKKGFQSFIGSMTEEVESGGIDDEILIEGVFDGQRIEFTKFYQSEHEMDQSGQIISNESDDPTIVHYEGEYFPDSEKFRGTWHIPMLKQDGETMIEDNLTGFWEMWKPH